MADLAMGAMGSVILKLGQLLQEEYKLQTGVKNHITMLTDELEHAKAALNMVAQVPWDQLNKQVQIWARKVREASYDMEDVLDTFLVGVKGPDSTEEKKSLRKFLKKKTNFFKKCKARRKISGDVKNIMTHVKEIMEQYQRYKVDGLRGQGHMTSTVDPRIHAMYPQVNKLVGMDVSSGELMSMLQMNLQRGDVSGTKMKIVSIVGVGGLGKTTLAKVVYDKVKGDPYLKKIFGCTAFAPVGRNPDLKKIFKDILIDLDEEGKYHDSTTATLDERQLINQLRKFFYETKKRYFVVIDDLWEEQSWETLKLAISDDNYCEGRIIITTRNWEVAKKADEVYKLPTLALDRSRELFYRRIYSDERKYVDHEPDKVSDKILEKCAGIPLAIITMASILVNEPRPRWLEVYDSIGFGCKDNEDVENNLKKILSFSYYDLPLHLRTCLLYLSAFPEDIVIPKVSLVWMWVAEGFIEKREGKGLFETGEGYFNVLINRSLIQEVEPNYFENHIHGCRVHDMILDFIRSMAQEENFFKVLDNNQQGTQSNVVRRLAKHNKTMVQSNQENMVDLSKLRSFIALNWVIDTCGPLSRFKLLRVLNIWYFDTILDMSCIGIEHLPHLRFLGIKGREVKKIPDEIESLKMLQTLNLESSLLEVPSSSSFPTQLVCLRMEFNYHAEVPETFSLGRLTSLEELSVHQKKPPRQLLKELGNLSKLRVLDTGISLEDDEVERDLIESVGKLDMLHHLKLTSSIIPSCIDPSRHCKLTHLDLRLFYMDEQELKTLGRMPELRFLSLNLWHASPSIHNISDSDACYFPKLRCLRLPSSMVFFLVNKGDNKKSVSFHIWDGDVHDSIIKPSVSDAELQGDEELQLLSVSDDVASVSDEEKKEGSISVSEGESEGAATPRFMPSLQLLHFYVCWKVTWHPRYLSSLGLNFLSSLREMSVCIGPSITTTSRKQVEEVEAALRRAAQIHPKHPTLRTRINWI